MKVLEELENVINFLNRIDEYKDNLNKELSIVDLKLSDLDHILENQKLSAPQCCKIVRERQKQRITRRKIKNDISLFGTYDKHINKMLNENNRNMLLAEMHKTNKRLQTQYKNRVYTDDEIKELLGVK